MPPRRTAPCLFSYAWPIDLAAQLARRQPKKWIRVWIKDMGWESFRVWSFGPSRNDEICSLSRPNIRQERVDFGAQHLGLAAERARCGQHLAGGGSCLRRRA